MILDQSLNKILIIDFGSQFTQLIARRIRELGVFSEIISHKKIKNKNIDISIKGIILSGGPLNVYEINRYSFDKKILKNNIPILGICFGHQILSKLNGGKVKQSKHREFGLANVYKKKDSLLIKNFFNQKKIHKVWMSHADQVSKLPKNFRVIASSQNSKFAIVEDKTNKFYGVQFHPEVTHTENGKKLISNFIFLICNIKRNWSSKDQKIKLIKEVREQVGSNKVICALSGGVDSSVVSTLCAKTGLRTIPMVMSIRNRDILGLEHAWWLEEKFENVSKRVVNLEKIFHEFENASKYLGADTKHAFANSRSRLRMMMLYQVATSENGLVIGTGNKVEDFGVGFYTKYGDGGVDISPIADCLKSDVWNMAKYLNI